MTKLNFRPPQFASAYSQLTYDGVVQVNVDVNQEYIALIEWVRDMKKAVEAEIELRNKNPILKEAYESYMTILKLSQ